MSDKRKTRSAKPIAIFDLSSSDDELSVENLRKKLRQEISEKENTNKTSFVDITQKQVEKGKEKPNGRPAYLNRLQRTRVDNESQQVSKSGSRNTSNSVVNYDTFLDQNNIQERKRSVRRNNPTKSSSADTESDSSSTMIPPPNKRKKTTNLETSDGAAREKKNTNKIPKRQKRIVKNSSSDSEDIEFPATMRSKRYQQRNNQDEETVSEISSDDGIESSYKKRSKKKKERDMEIDSEDDMEDRLSSDSDSDSDEDKFTIEKILARETHSKLKWTKKTQHMQSHYITNGSIFVEDDEDESKASTSSSTGTSTEENEGNDGEAATSDNEIEKFLVKWRNLSYLHVTWETKENLLEYEEQAKNKIQRFLDKEAMRYLMDDMQGDEYFNPEFCIVDRILKIQPSEVPKEDGKKGFQDEYFVKWKGLPYDECTWEQEVDVHDDQAVQIHHHFNKEVIRPPPSKRRGQFRPYNDRTNPIVFKNKMKLREYQVTGVNWMIFNWYNNRNSLLADEMGLGKTVQTVGYVNHLATKENLVGPYLIIAPLSTLAHWQREFTGWTNLNAIIFHGNQDARKIIETHEFYRPQRAKKDNSKKYRFDVLITTYEMCTGNNYLTLARIPWQLVVVDEAHRLKNIKSKFSSMLDEKFKYNNILLLTGTPLQNNIEELWTLLHFLDPKKFHSVEDFSALFGDLKDSSQVGRLHNELKPFLLRRMKEDVEKSIAPKEETIIEVELTVLQKQYYRAIYEKNSEFLSRGGKKSNAPSLMNIVMELRKCCNHPFLIRGVEEREANRLQKDLPKSISSSEKQNKLQEQLNELLVSSSGKLVLLDKLLPRLREGGHRVLIFSQFKIMLNILEDYLRLRGYPRERIDGSITGNDRQAAIDRFSDPQSTSFVMLLSTRAGGVGINLTAADTCIIYDSDWNPQNDLQAQARCHRIGQTKSVKVYRVLTSKTYELHMFNQASMKLGLDQAVLGGIRQVKSTEKGPSKEEIENLLKFGAYEMFKEDKDGEAEAASKKFSEESVDEILSRSTTVIHDPKKQETSSLFSSSFSKATFVSSSTDEQVALDDPDFWTKVIGLTGIETTTSKNKTPEKRRCKGRKTYTEVGSDEDRPGYIDNDGEYKFEDISESSSDDEDSTGLGNENKSTTPPLVHQFHDKFANALLTFGFGRWTKLRMSDPQLMEFSVDQVKEYSFGYLVQLIRVACMDMVKNTEGDPSSVFVEAMPKMALKFKFIVFWLQALDREKHPESQAPQIYDIFNIKVPEQLTRSAILLSLSKVALKYLQHLEKLFVLDRFMSKFLNPMLDVFQVLNEKYDSDGVATGTQPETKESNPELATSHGDNQVTMPSTEKSAENCTIISQGEKSVLVMEEEQSILDDEFTPLENPMKKKVSREMVKKWRDYFNSLIALSEIPAVKWWKCPDDDLRLIFGVYRYGWIYGTKIRTQLFRNDKILYPPGHPANDKNAPWPTQGVINTRIRQIIQFWALRSFQQPTSKLILQPGQNGYKETTPRDTTKKPNTFQGISPAITSANPRPNQIQRPQTSHTNILPAPSAATSTHSKYLQQICTRRNRFIQLIIGHGIPDVRLCTSPAEEREKWRFFLYDGMLHAKFFTPAELLLEAISLELVSRCLLSNSTPPPTNATSIFGALRTDWILTMEQARSVIKRIDLFRLLRREVLIMRPSDLRNTMVYVMPYLPRPVSAPAWWKSPDCDILLMQGVECFGLHEHVHEMWQLDLFQKLNPTGYFPNDLWIESTVMNYANAISRSLKRRVPNTPQVVHHPKAIHSTPQVVHHPKAIGAMPTSVPNIGVIPIPPVVSTQPLHIEEERVRREIRSMANEDPKTNSKAYMWMMIQKKDAEMNRQRNLNKIHQLNQQKRHDIVPVSRQVDLMKTIQKKKIEKKQPEVIEISDSE